MKMVEKSGKTIDEAIEAALAELGVGRENVEIEVLEEGNKGIFGIIGVRLARVRLTVKDDPAGRAVAFLEEIFKSMNVQAQIDVKMNGDNIYICFSGKDLGILIGRRGDTLDALQYLVNLAVNKSGEKRVKIVLDVEEYRKRREETIVKLAHRLSDKVKRTKKNVVLEPMNPHERRVIHTALQNDPSVYTFSQGNEPYRKVVISLKK
ncbi:MAG: protein jag [Firmicutes bacterium]|nr:protein jag [Bacillota bacterium]